MPKPSVWKFIPKNIYNRVLNKKGSVRCNKCGKKLGRKELVYHRFTTNHAKRYCAKCGAGIRL